MFTSPSKKTILIAAASAVMFIFSACHNGKNGDNGYNSPTAAACSCEANWFPHATTPNTIDGKGGPFDVTSTSNCQFHQWSWQKFLWLTRPMTNGHAFFQDSLIQVNSKLDTIQPQVGLVLVLDDSTQAGSQGNLHTNPTFGNNKKSNLVYYSIFANHTLLSASRLFKALIAANLMPLNNDSTFPNGSLELKVSWVDINAIPQAQQASYYTTDAAIKSIVKGVTIYTPTKVALLGMHVVGRVINHPEFIWATFEHHNMAPLYNWAATTSTQDAPIAPANNTLFYITNPLNGIIWNSPETLAAQPAIPYSAFSLYKYGTPRVALDSFMAGVSQPGPVNYANIDSLNACVAANLDPSSVWRNYFYNGSIWLNMDQTTPLRQAFIVDSLADSIGNAVTGSFARGSLNAANITMETYVQTNINTEINRIHTITADSVFNCFGCHTARANILFHGKKTSALSPLLVSHLFRGFAGTDSKTTVEEVKLEAVRDFLIKKKSFAKLKTLDKKLNK